MLQFVKSVDASKGISNGGSTQLPIFTADNTPIPGSIAMVIVFKADAYGKPGVHDDNEGFFVISGEGKMVIGDTEYSLQEGCAMLVPAGTAHMIKRTGEAELKVFIYHFPCA